MEYSSKKTEGVGFIRLKYVTFLNKKKLLPNSKGKTQMWRNVLKYVSYKGLPLGNQNISDPSHQISKVPIIFFWKIKKKQTTHCRCIDGIQA